MHFVSISSPDLARFTRDLQISGSMKSLNNSSGRTYENCYRWGKNWLLLYQAIVIAIDAMDNCTINNMIVILQFASKKYISD